MAGFLEAAELLDVHVQEVSRAGPLVADHRRRLRPGCREQPPRRRTRCTVEWGRAMSGSSARRRGLQPVFSRRSQIFLASPSGTWAGLRLRARGAVGQRRARLRRSASVAARQRRTHSQQVDFATFEAAAAASNVSRSSSTSSDHAVPALRGERGVSVLHPGLLEVVSFDTHSLSAGPDLPHGVRNVSGLVSYNMVSTGIAVLGSFMATPISSAARGALEALLGWKLSLHGIPAHGSVTVRVNLAGAFYSRYPANARVSLPRVAGHRDGDSTDCPGNVLYGELPRSAPAYGGRRQTRRGQRSSSPRHRPRPARRPRLKQQGLPGPVVPRPVRFRP